MSVENTTTKVIYNGNGMTTEWPVPFSYSKPDHIFLLLTDAKGVSHDVPSNYRVNVTEAGDTSVTYPVTGEPLPGGAKLTIYRQTPQTQILDLIYGGAFAPEVLERDGFDRLVMMIQEMNEEIERAIKIAIDAGSVAPSIEEVYAVISEQLARVEAAAAATEAALLQAKTLLSLIPVPQDRDVGSTLYVMRIEGKAQYVLMRGGSGGGSGAGFADYSIPAREASGLVSVVLADIGHPAMLGPFNPVINIISLKPYTFVIRSRSAEGFTVQLYKADGTPGVEFAEFIEFGRAEFGDGTEFGAAGSGSDVELAVSIPLPPQ